ADVQSFRKVRGDPVRRFDRIVVRDDRGALEVARVRKRAGARAMREALRRAVGELHADRVTGDIERDRPGLWASRLRTVERVGGLERDLRAVERSEIDERLRMTELILDDRRVAIVR